MDRVDRAVSRFEEGFSCSQAVLATYGPQFGLDRETALRVAGPFGGGMARMGETCGAVTGALMAIGLRYAKTEADDDEAKEVCYDCVREFVARFKARNGSVRCRELLGCDIGTPEGRRRAVAQELFTTLCPRLVRDAAEIVGRIMGGE